MSMPAFGPLHEPFSPEHFTPFAAGVLRVRPEAERFPPRPASPQAGEALLTRLESGPDRLRNALDGHDVPRAAPVLLKARMWEAWLACALQRLGEGRPFKVGGNLMIRVPPDPTVASGCDAFAGERAENMAVVRGRGAALWEQGSPPGTAHQVLAAMAALDDGWVELLRGER